MYTIETAEKTKTVYGQLALKDYLNELKERGIKVKRVSVGVL